MDYQRYLQSQQRKSLKDAIKLNEQMRKINNDMYRLNNLKQLNMIPQQVIEFLQCMSQYGIKVTRNNILQFYNNNVQYFSNSLGQLTDDKIKLIQYANKLSNGEQTIEDEKDLKKLLKTVSLNRYKISINDLKIQRYKIYLTNFNKESTDNIMKALNLFGIKDPKKTMIKIAKKQRTSEKPISYLVGVYLEWDMVGISKQFREFQKDNQATIDIIIQVDKNEIISVPKYVTIKNITEEPFTIYNSKKQDCEPIFYEVEGLSTTTGRITVRTTVKPVIKYKGKTETKGLKIIVPTETELGMGRYKKGEVKLYVDKGYYSLCNRFIITGTLRPPLDDVNLGYYKMLAKDGTTVYVSARLVPYNKTLSSGIREQRIYYVGFNANEIESRLNEYTKNLQTKLGGYVTERVGGTVGFTLYKQTEKLRYDT